MKTDQLLDLYEQALEENLRDWFKEKWVRFGPDGKIRGDCARGDDSEGKPKCLPQKKAHALGKEGRASAARRKRREDPNPERRGKAINVATKKKTNEEQIEELKCWDGYRRVPGRRPGSPGSCTKATAESMDGVSQGTHMFTSEENTPARKGTISTFGPAGRVGIKNKERILRAASYVNTKQPNHPQSQAKLYMFAPGSPNSMREVAALDTADTKLLAQFLQAFFRNPELNRAHKWLYDFLSEPGKVQQLANQISRQPKYLEFIQQVKDPAHIRSFIAALDSIRPEITEKWSAKYKRSINCSNPKGFSQRAHCQGRKKK